jgi:SPP1 gp7 family putative phage head morphogenesis protein
MATRRTTTRIRRTSGREGPRAPMQLVDLMQSRMINLVNAYIDRLMRALEPELRKRFLHQDANARSPITLVRRTLESLGALPADANDRQSTLKGLRESEEFKRTGRAPRSFDREGHERGITVVVQADGSLILRDGRHRFTVAKELGIDSIWGTVLNANGRVLFVGDIPLKAAAREGATAVAASTFETGATTLTEGFLHAAFRLVDHQAAADLQRVAGVPIDAVLPNARKLEQTWLRNNTDLIQLEERARREVEAIITNPQRQGRRVEQVRAEIQERLNVTRSRAELIARDQTLKMYGQIQEERQTAAGIERYVWSTSDDERVRPDHEDLDGTEQRWDSPPIVDKRTGRREHPGLDFQCRCSAVPILDD